MRPRVRHRQHSRGVTLLEVVLAMAVLVLLSSTMYWFYASTLESREKGQAESQRLRLVRAILDRMATEIRQASITTADGRAGIRGTAERIWLSTIRVPDREFARKRFLREGYQPDAYDLTKVEYKIIRHPQAQTPEGYYVPLGLARVEIPVPRPDSLDLGAGLERNRQVFGGDEGESAQQSQLEEQQLEGNLRRSNTEPSTLKEMNFQELYSQEILFLRFCYYDGKRWWDTWEVDGENPLPQLVQVTIGYTPTVPFEEEFSDRAITEFCTCMNHDPVDCLPQPPDRFTVNVRVPQADPLFRSRVGRETQDFMEQLSGGGGGGAEGGGGGETAP
ncbi:MAG: type II secretion system protein [Phycisphaerae bacterium]|nr:type II secretion system protein [Phycisphaerae bacterium]